MILKPAHSGRCLNLGRFLLPLLEVQHRPAQGCQVCLQALGRIGTNKQQRCIVGGVRPRELYGGARLADPTKAVDGGGGGNCCYSCVPGLRSPAERSLYLLQ